MEEQFEWLRKKLDPTGEFPYPLDLNKKALPDLEHKEIEINADLEHIVTEIETDLEKKENKFINKATIIGSPAPVVGVLEKKVHVQTLKTEQVVSLGSSKHWLEVSHLLISNSLYSHIREVYKIKSTPSLSKIERSFEKVNENNSDSNNISAEGLQIKANYARHVDLDLLSPLVNGTSIIKRFLYPKFCNYMKKKLLKMEGSQVMAYGIVVCELNENKMNLKFKVAMEVDISNYFPCIVENDTVLNPNEVKMSSASYTKLQVTTFSKNLDNFFFWAVFDPGGTQDGRLMHFQILEDKDFKGKAMS